MISNLLGPLLGLFKELFIPVAAYFQGKKAQRYDYLKEEKETREKHDKIEQDNARKSDVDILNELQKRDTRGEQ